MSSGRSPRPSPRRGQKKLTFGILTTPAKNIFHSNYHIGLLAGIMPQVKAVKGRLKIVMMPAKPYRSLDEILTRHKLDGLLILTWRWIHPSVAQLIETTAHPRVAIVNDPIPGLRVNSVYTDVDAGMAQAVGHLVKKGYRRIGMLHGPWEVPFKDGRKTVRVPFIDTQLKVKGLLCALKAKGLRRRQDWFRSGAANSEAEGYRVARAWLREKNIPEAIVCGNDDLAFGALRAMREAGKKLGVIGFDDNERAKDFTPPLTTIRQPLAKMGKDAVAVLTRQIRAWSGKPVRRKYLPRLIVRKTA